MNKLVPIVMFLSSYIPLFVIIIIQNGFKIINNDYFESTSFNLALNSWNSFHQSIGSLLKHGEVIIILSFTILIISLLLSVKKLLISINENDSITIDIEKIENINHSLVTNYFAVYIFPFITMDLTSLLGIVQFIFLGSIIGYVYIKNDLIYINPILNIIFKFNIYKAEILYSDENTGNTRANIVLISKREKNDLENKTNVEVVIKSEDFYINIK